MAPRRMHDKTATNEPKLKRVASQREGTWVERLGKRVVELVNFPNPPRVKEGGDPRRPV
jgi:hypothetical protein